MRGPDDMPTTAAEFSEALAGARRGLITSDLGADDRLYEALVTIAIHGATPEREAEARAAFAAMR